MADSKPLAEIADLLQEDRSFEPPAAFRDAANVPDASVYARADADPERFWADFASELGGPRRGRGCSSGTRRMRSGSSAER